ncbi:MAG: YfhO family protein [Thermodesulfovibrionales bacterium]
MMFFRRAVVFPGFKNKVVTGIFLTISFLGGGVEIVYGIFFILFFMVVFLVSYNSFKKDYLIEKLRYGIKTLLIVSIIFLIFSAVQLVPFVELIYHSVRHGGISFHEATTWSFALKDMLLFFLPDAYGYFLDIKKYWVTQCWLKTLYTGGLPFILSTVYFIYGKNRKLFLSLMLFSIFLALGRYNPLYQFLFKYFPFFDSIRYPVKFLFIFILVLSITAGLGFDNVVSLIKKDKGKKFNNFLIISAFISGLLLLLLVLGNEEIEHFMKLKGINFPDFNYALVNLYNSKRFFFYLTVFFLLLRVGQEMKWKNWIRFLLIIFLTADLFGNMGFYGKEKTTEYFKKTRILEMISSDKGQFRVFTTAKTISMDVPILIGNATYIDYLKEKHLPSMNQLYRIHDIWGIDVIHLKRTDELYRALTETPSISATNLIDLYGVKYVISVTPIESDPNLELIYARTENLKGKRDDLLKENTIKLYRNNSYIPRAWLVKDFKIMDSKDILTEIKKKDFNPKKVVFLEKGPNFNTPSPLSPLGKGFNLPLSPLGKGGIEGGLVEFLYESNNKLNLLVKSNNDAFLVLNDTYFPGWKVYINGKEEKIYRADYNFRAVPVKAGIQKVEFVYDPLSFKLGAIISISGVIGCVIIGFFILYGRRKRLENFL